TVSGYGYLPAFSLVTDPIATDNDPQGRISPLYVFSDTFHMQKGKHAVKFGGEVRFSSSNGFNGFDVTPRVAFGIGEAVNIVGIDSSSIPGLGANEGIAQALAEDLSGSVGAVSQAFNALGGTRPKFQAGETKQRTWRQREFSLFVQ